MSKLSKEQFEAYLEQIKNLAEGPFEEMQPEIEVTNVFPEKFYELAKENDLVPLRPAGPVRRLTCPSSTSLQRAGAVLPRPGRHAHAPALRRRPGNWRILDDYGSDERRPSTWTSSRTRPFHLLRPDRAVRRHRRRHPHHRGQGRERRLHPQRREVADLPHRPLRVRLRHRRSPTSPSPATSACPPSCPSTLRLRGSPSMPHMMGGRRCPHRPGSSPT